MTIPQNVQKSGFRPKEYFGWDGGGQPWRIFRVGTRWRAVPAPAHRSPWASPMEARTLGDLAAGLASRDRRVSIDPTMPVDWLIAGA